MAGKTWSDEAKDRFNARRAARFVEKFQPPPKRAPQFDIPATCPEYNGALLVHCNRPEGHPDAHRCCSRHSWR